MTLPFHPHPGTVLMCNFDTGFRPPEMTKVRPVVAISPRRRRGAEVTTVVPLSTTQPEPVEPFHHRLNASSLPGKFAESATWAKGDMVCTVGLARLDRVMIGKDGNGKRVYVAQGVTEGDLVGIRKAVANALGIDVGVF